MQFFIRSRTSSILSALFLLNIASADQELQQNVLQNALPNSAQSHRIAIIGAGAGGASAAYHLSQFANTSHLHSPIAITIYDINNRAGGRTTTVNALDDPNFPVEVGASIFVKVNHILYNASRNFGLSIDSPDSPTTGSFYELGIWDGKDFLLTSENDPERDGGLSGRWKGWWDIAKLLWRYGLSPIRTNQLMKSTIGKFLKLYDEVFPFDDLDASTADVGLDDFTGVTGREALTRGGISEEFARHVVQASTRVNYAQNLGNIHGLEAMVCMATDGAVSVEGGNWQIFDEFVKRSTASSRYTTKVTSVQKTSKNKFRISSTSATQQTDKENKVDEFDTVILAAPYQFANVTFTPALANPPAKVDYVKLHVTLFTSSYLPSPKYFGLDGQWEVPDTILTTLPPDHNVSDEDRGTDAVGPTEFWSISTRAIESKSSGKQYLYKIFSPAPISVKFLGRLFNFATNTTTGHLDDFGDQSFESFAESSDLISWYHLKIWDSYPYLPPTTKFPPIHLDHNVYYTSAIEPFISTMETSALSGRNVARLIIDRLKRDTRTSHTAGPELAEKF